jgi:hypothetical protein
MATIASALNTPFTPASGDFIVQVTGGAVHLMRANAAGATPTLCGTVGQGAAMIVHNPVLGAIYTALPAGGTPVFQADQ